MGSELDAAKGIWVSRSRNRPGFFSIGMKGGEEERKEKRKKKKGMRGEGLGFPLRSSGICYQRRGRAPSREGEVGTNLQEGSGLAP